MSNKTIYTTPAQIWYEAQPLGNGKLGAMVYGGVENEEITLNHDTLWSGRPGSYSIENAPEIYKEIKELVFSGKYNEADKLASEKFLIGNSETYLPFGSLKINFKTKNASGYKKVLDFSRALLNIEYESENVVYRREYFVSFPDNVMVVKISADKKGCVSFDATIESELKNTVYTENSMLIADGECPGTSNAATSMKQVYEYSDKPEEKGISFRGVLKAVADGGEVVYEKNTVSVKDADSAVIVFSISTSFNGFDKHPFLEGREYKNAAVSTVLAAAEKSYEELLSAHLEDYCTLYDKIELDLGSSGREEMPTPERLRLFNSDGNDISIYTLLFNFGRYLTIASSREGSQATNLQGIWNNKLMPPWRSNYTVNINTEMNYWPTLMCGLDNCFEPLISMMEDCSIAGEKTAKEFYVIN